MPEALKRTYQRGDTHRDALLIDAGMGRLLRGGENAGTVSNGVAGRKSMPRLQLARCH